MSNEYKNAKTDKETLEIYKDSILELAKGMIEKADSNHDGVMDKEEFLNQELKDYKVLFGDEELAKNVRKFLFKEE